MFVADRSGSRNAKGMQWKIDYCCGQLRHSFATVAIAKSNGRKANYEKWQMSTTALLPRVIVGARGFKTRLTSSCSSRVTRLECVYTYTQYKNV